jgi:hypothetical protein
MDASKLLYALDDETNESIMSLNTKKIMQLNLDILKELHLPRDITLDYLKKLKNYRYIDELNELKYGSFIRWIPIIDPNYLPLHNTAMICDIKIIDDGVLITCKTFMHRHYTFKMDECLIFQKLTTQEQVIISALDHLENSKDETEDDEDEDETEDDEDET